MDDLPAAQHPRNPYFILFTPHQEFVFVTITDEFSFPQCVSVLSDSLTDSDHMIPPRL